MSRFGSVRLRVFVVALVVAAFLAASVVPAFASSPYKPKVGSKTRKALMKAARAKAADPDTKYRVYELWAYKGYAVGNMVKYPEATPHTKYSFENNIYIWKKKAGKWRLTRISSATSERPTRPPMRSVPATSRCIGRR